jgi:hypothetical protein
MVDAARDAGVKFDEAGFESCALKSRLAPALQLEGREPEVGQPGVSRAA